MVEAETLNSRDKALIPMRGSSMTSPLQILEEFCRTNAIRLLAMSLSSSHSLVVSITIIHFMPDCSYSALGALSSNRNLLILMAGVDHHDTCYSPP